MRPEVRVIGGRICWYCQVCGGSIAADQGYLHVDTRRAQEVKRAHEAWEADLRTRRASADGLLVYPVSEFMDLPNQAPWEVHHRSCDPEPNRDDYWISVERIDRYWKVLHWTAHMLGKGWFEHTSWADVCYAFSGGRSA